MKSLENMSLDKLIELRKEIDKEVERKRSLCGLTKSEALGEAHAYERLMNCFRDDMNERGIDEESLSDAVLNHVERRMLYLTDLTLGNYQIRKTRRADTVTPVGGSSFIYEPFAAENYPKMIDELVGVIEKYSTLKKGDNE